MSGYEEENFDEGDAEREGNRALPTLHERSPSMTQQAIPMWVLTSAPVLVTIIGVGISWGSMSARMASLEARVDKQVSYYEGVSKALDSDRKFFSDKLEGATDNLTKKIDATETARQNRSEILNDRLAELSAKVVALTVQMGFLSNKLTFDGQQKKTNEPR